jgi:tol-pal system protein YbgF
VIRRWLVGTSAVLLVGCATKGSVKRVETQVLVLRAENARQDSVRAAELARIIRLQQQVLDSLTNTRQALRVFDAKFGADLTDVQRQLLQIQELTGQSQRQLSVVKAAIDARAEAQSNQPTVTAPVTSDSTPPAAPPSVPSVSAEQMYTGALQQFRAQRPAIARQAFLRFLQEYPTHPNVPDAMYFVAETMEAQTPDSAIARYEEIKTKFPQHRRAPTALYKIGYIYETALKDSAKARAAYQRLITEYPRSEDVELAKSRLGSLKP